MSDPYRDALTVAESVGTLAAIAQPELAPVIGATFLAGEAVYNLGGAVGRLAAPLTCRFGPSFLCPSDWEAQRF
jgi:hypothetical protein